MRGIAGTAALAPAVMPSSPGKTTLTLSSDFYDGETGMSVGFAHRLNWPVLVMLHGTCANGGGTQHVGPVAATLEAPLIRAKAGSDAFESRSVWVRERRSDSSTPPPTN